MSKTLRVINISTLMPERHGEVTGDLLRLRRDCGVTDVAFMLPLCPEGATPSLAKAERLAELFRERRGALQGSGLKVGMLLQSTLGHGGPNSSGFKRSVNANGATTASLCPLAPGLGEHLREAVAVVAAAKPDFLIVDDDFRLANGGAPGCFCELHLAALERATGRKLDRESLLKALESDKESRRSWDAVRLESLLVLARGIRAGIDASDPKLPCGFCVCDAGGMELQFAHKIEETLAGGNPQLVRVNSAWYWSGDPKSLLARVYWTAAQTKALKDIPEVLAESDTYPHNRHYTSAKALDAQIIFSLLHGCTGLKLWVSRLHEFQPESGEAYRLTLKAKLGAYRELRRLVPQVDWDGPNTPLPAELSEIPAAGNPIRGSNWTCAVMAHMGIPATVGAAPEGVTMLTGPECDLFDDAAIKVFLAKGLLLDGPAAERLRQRGFGRLLGVDADFPEGWSCSFERMNDDPVNGAAAGKSILIAALSCGAAVRLTPNVPGVRTLSTMFRRPFYLSEEELEVGAGLTLHENELGGRVAVYAAAVGATAFMDEARREQLVNVLGWLNRGPLPMVAVSDLDLYALHGRIRGGGELLALFNLNLDPLSQLRLRCGGEPPTSIEALSGDGSWRALAWSRGAGADVIVEAGLDSVTPLILKIKR